MAVAVGMLAALAASPAPAAEDLTLQGVASQAEYTAGQPVVLTFTVTNGSGRECAVAALPDGALTITAVSRDGAALEPALAPASYLDGLENLMLAGLAPAATGTGPQVEVGSAGRGALRSVTWSPDGGVLARWPVDQPGEYAVTAVYAYPQLPGRPAGVCTGTTAPVTVAFTVGDADGGRGLPGWLFPAIGAGVLVLALAGWLLWRSRRRGTPTPPGPVTAVLVVLSLVPVAVLGAPAPAYAQIVFADPGDAGLQSAYAGCVRGFEAEDGSGDPLGIYRYLQFSPHKVVIAREPHPAKGAIPGSFSTPNSWPDATNGTGTGSQIDWNPQHHGQPMAGTTADRCAQLYHEMYHSYEYAKGVQDSANCKATDRGPEHPQAATREIAASLAENAYRRHHGLTPRDSYNGLKLPNSVDDCYDKNKPRPPRKYPANPSRPGGDCPARGCGGSNGDPHLTTFDERHYDLQAAGEFVLVTGDGLQVQARQVPYPGSRTVSVNSAVALDVGGDRVAFYQDGGVIEVRLAGTPATVTEQPTRLPRGGTVSRTPGAAAYLAVWPDGSSAAVQPLGGWGLNVDVRLAAARRGAVRGLLGDFDGDPGDDLVTRDGKPVPTPDFSTLYGAYADGWRVRDGESLFDYAPGQDTHTFTVKGFPERPVDAAGVASRATAELICRAAGVTGQPFLDNCIVDVAATGQAAFVTGAADAHAAGAAAGGGTPAPTPSPGPAAPSQSPVPAGQALRDGSTVAGQITDPARTVRYDLDLGTATSFYVADWRGTTDRCDQTFGVNLVGVSHGHFPCTGGNVFFTLPTAGAPNQLEVHSTSTGTGPYSFTLITAKPRELSTAPGAVVTGRLDVRGREDRHALPAGLTSVTLSDTAGCDDNVFAGVLDLTSGTTLVGYNPLCGGTLGPYRLPDASHRYAVSVYSTEVKTGAYGFTVG